MTVAEIELLREMGALSPYMMETSIKLADIISWAVYGGGIISLGVWIKITVMRHDSVIYDKQGEVRLVSVEALARKEKAWEKARATEGHHNITQVETLTLVISELQKDIKQLSRCVSIMASGGRVDSTDGC